MLFFASHQIIIRRQRSKSGLRWALSATGTVQEADIQPIEGERINLVQGRIGKTYEAWMDASIDVKEGDQLKIVDTGKLFAVKAVSTYQSAELLDHHHLILMSQD